MSSNNRETALIGSAITMIAGFAGMIANGEYTDKQEAAVTKEAEEVYEAIQQERREKEKSLEDTTSSMSFLSRGSGMMGK